MATKEIKGKQRISKTQGRVMMGVGVFFDLFPLIVLAVAAYLLFQAFSSWAVEDYVYHSGKAADWCAYSVTHPYNLIAKERCFHHKTRARNSLYYAGGIFAITGGTASVFVGPIIYTAASFLSTITAYLCFTFWFLSKRVYMWSFSKPERVFVNMVTLVIENVPLLDILPGTTLMVWRHVKISQMEDKNKSKKAGEDLKRKVTSINRMSAIAT